MIYCTGIRIFSVITLGLTLIWLNKIKLKTPINYNNYFILFFRIQKKRGGGVTRNDFVFRRFRLFLLILLVCDFNNLNIPRGIRTYHHLPTSSRSAYAYRASMPKRPPDYISSTSIDIFQDEVSVTNSGYIIIINTGGSY